MEAGEEEISLLDLQLQRISTATSCLHGYFWSAKYPCPSVCYCKSYLHDMLTIEELDDLQLPHEADLVVEASEKSIL